MRFLQPSTIFNDPVSKTESEYKKFTPNFGMYIYYFENKGPYASGIFLADMRKVPMYTKLFCIKNLKASNINAVIHYLHESYAINMLIIIQ